MTKHQEVAKALKARLSELKHRVAEIDRELHTQLSADSEEQYLGKVLCWLQRYWTG
jgi:hypothetical protein